MSDDYTSQFSVTSYTRKKVNQTRKKNKIIKLVAKRRNLKVTRSQFGSVLISFDSLFPQSLVSVTRVRMADGKKLMATQSQQF